MRTWLAFALWLVPVAAPAQGVANHTHVLIITGLSADPRFAKSFGAAATMIYDSARSAWHVPDSSLIWLAEDSLQDVRRIKGKSTKENVQRAFLALGMRAAPGDVFLVFLLGHGSGEHQESAVNLPGPDPLARDYAEWVQPFARATVVFVNASTGSGDFIEALSAPNRIVITATKTALERNESIFAGIFARGLTSPEADADKDGRVSVLEAYQFARQEVAKTYTSTNRMQTEHSLLDDNGDGKGTADPGQLTGGDGALARRVAFGGTSTSADPRVIALVAQQRTLEASVDSLRRVKATMDSVAYEKELERLLLLIAKNSQAIKDLERGGKP